MNILDFLYAKHLRLHFGGGGGGGSRQPLKPASAPAPLPSAPTKEVATVSSALAHRQRRRVGLSDTILGGALTNDNPSGKKTILGQ
jgi:hypothetical protein